MNNKLQSSGEKKSKTINKKLIVENNNIPSETTNVKNDKNTDNLVKCNQPNLQPAITTTETKILPKNFYKHANLKCAIRFAFS